MSPGNYIAVNMINGPVIHITNLWKMHAILYSDMHKFKLIFNASYISNKVNVDVLRKFVLFWANSPNEHFQYKMYSMADIGITFNRERDTTESSHFTLFYISLFLLLLSCSFHLKCSDFYPSASFSRFLHAFILLI